MRSLTALLSHRRRPEPPLDIGLPAERTAMAWQRTGLGLAGFSALLVHLADRRPVLAAPGVLGLAVALWVLLVGERRYSWTVRRIEAEASPVAPHLAVLLTAAVVLLSASALVLVVMLGI